MLILEEFVWTEALTASDSTKPNQLDQSYKREEILQELRREIINIQHKIGRKEGRKVERRKANCTGHSLHRNCFLKHAIEGRTGVTGRRGRRRKQLLSNFKDTRRYWKLKEKTLNRTPWRICFWRGYGSVVGQTDSCENDFSEDRSKTMCFPPKTLIGQYCWRK